MRDEALRLIAEHPWLYAGNVIATARLMFRPATEWAPVRHAGRPDRRLARRGVRCAAWRARRHRRPHPGSLLAAAVLGHALVVAFRILTRRSRANSEHRVLVFAALTIGYVFAVAVLLDTNETMRHRLKLDGLLVVAALIGGRALWRRLLAWRVASPDAASRS